MTTAGFYQAAHEGLPLTQQVALHKAVRWQIFTIAYTTCTIVVVAQVLGSSQAMKTAWVEDILSLIPQISFLVAMRYVKRPPTRAHPYGMHRAMGTGHLVAGVALAAVGTNLAWEAITGLIAGDHPTIGTVNLLHHTVWLGWLMIAVMVLIVVGPLFLYGPAKARLAPELHNKLLFADADMAKADWHTNAASIVGVLGTGLGVWWLDGAAALFISIGIMRDGFTNARSAILDLMDQTARQFDDSEVHPLATQIVEYLESQSGILKAGIRMRDQGQVFHVEAFVTPTSSHVSLEDMARIAQGVGNLDWKIQDVVVVPTDPLPPEVWRGVPSDQREVARGSVIRGRLRRRQSQ
ncbi:cation diffusion facilitator family transporter [Changpingibacter yushuensis]|uniref:cation diffusion facilitator family transporter n=1 Tax=Changpingibacter yushuensis TaxID=2758440 RepID=UPI0015F4A61D|nr:cation transporter [Changpingibacter yushuensis]